MMGQKTPIILNVIIKNRSNETQLVSVITKTPLMLGFDKTGLTREKRVRIDYIKPSQEKIVPFPLYARYNIEPGAYPVDVKVMMHPDRYDRVADTIAAQAQVRVIS